MRPSQREAGAFLAGAAEDGDGLLRRHGAQPAKASLPDHARRHDATGGIERRQSGRAVGSQPALRRNILVERRALPRCAAEGDDQRIHLLGRKLLTVLGARRPRDAFVHQGAAEIVGAGIEAGGCRVRSKLDPGDLDVGDQRMQCEPRHRMHQDRLALRRSLAGAALQIERRLHMHERQGDEFGEPAGSLLQVADVQQVACPVFGPVDVPEHDGCRGPQSPPVRGLDGVEPLLCRQLVRAEHRANAVVENLRRGSGQAAEPRLNQAVEIVADAEPEACRAMPHFERRKGVHMHAAFRAFHGVENSEIGRAGVAGMDAALHADFGRAAIPRFAHPSHDFLVVEVVGRAAQGVAELALGEGAEAAAVIADVGVVDVAVDDVTDGLAVDALVSARRRPRRPHRIPPRAP